MSIIKQILYDFRVKFVFYEFQIILKDYSLYSHQYTSNIRQCLTHKIKNFECSIETNKQICSYKYI